MMYVLVNVPHIFLNHFNHIQIVSMNIPTLVPHLFPVFPWVQFSPLGREGNLDILLDSQEEARL